jgi:isoleucyl-tRNA synthetase
VVALDTTVTPELHAEGVARDLVRLVQQARKDADLDVTDRIALTLRSPPSSRPWWRPTSQHLADSVTIETSRASSRPRSTATSTITRA